LTARIINIGRELIKQGHEVVLIAPSADKYSDYKTQKVSTIDGIKVIYPVQLTSRSQVLNFLPYVPAVAWRIWRQKADIIHLYKPTPLTLVGLLAGIRVKTKVILDMDDLGSQVMVREGNAKWKVWLVEKAEHLAGRYSDAIISASSYLRDYYSAKYPTKSVIWVPNGVRAYVPGLAKNGSPIVFIGSLNHLGILMPLIESLPTVVSGAESDSPMLHIIGDGSMRTELMTKTIELGLQDEVRFSDGWVSVDELKHHVYAGSLGYICVPDDDTYKAASSQKVFNYLSLGIVPVVNRVGDLPYYVEDGISGYIVGQDLASTLINAIADIDDRAARVIAGRKYIEDNFLWSVLADQITDFYRSQLIGKVESK